MRKALKVDFTGADHFIIANSDTVMETGSADLMRQVYPGVPLRKELTGAEPCFRSIRPVVSSATSRNTLGASPRKSPQT